MSLFDTWSWTMGRSEALRELDEYKVS